MEFGSEFCPGKKLHSEPEILCRKKDGDWYIYPQLLAHKNLNNVRKSIQETYKIFKPGLHNVLSTGTNIVRIGLSLCLMGCG